MKKSDVVAGCIKSMHGVLTAQWSKLPDVWRSIICGVSFVVIVITVALVAA